MSSQATGGEKSRALAWAEEAHTLVQAHPRRARALAQRALAEAKSGGDTKAEVAARYALGWAQFVLGEALAARATLRAGIRLAHRSDDRRGAGLLRRHLAYQLAYGGETRAAQREIAAALASLTGLERARSQVHRLDIHRKSHVPDPYLHRRVLGDAASALRRFRKERDEIWEARLLVNRGLLHLDRGEFGRAEADLHRARDLYQSLGARAAALNAVGQIARLALMRGDLVLCLRTLAAVQEQVASADLDLPYIVENLEECRALALTQARLLPEAHAAARTYFELCRRWGLPDHVSPATLEHLTVALMSTDPAEATRFATATARSYAARGKPVDAALARVGQVRAQLAGGEVRRSTLRTGLAAAAVLDRAGWRHDALRTRVLVARLALETGAAGSARKQLELARPLWTRGTAADRIELCHARALLRIAENEPAAAERELERGLRILDEYRSALGAAELRATASGLGSELSLVGLRIALASGRPAKILSWAERLRANALRLPAVRPPADAKLRTLQVELRRAIEQQATARQARLEVAVRSRTRLVDAKGAARLEVAETREVARLLGGRMLVEYLELGDERYALTLADGELLLHGLSAKSADVELDWLRFACSRLAGGRLSPEQRAATLANATASAAALEELLIAPLREALGEAPLVIVPTGALHALPWAALPSLKGRPFVVAPSLALWCDLATRPRSRRRKAALVAGPRLRHAAAEVKELGALRPGATVLHGKAATAEAVLAALDGAAIAHLACHGHFRADSPLFSSLELADGPLNVYELQQLRRAPEVVVLSACDLGLSQTHPGDELLGLAAALLGMGTRTIVASVVPVPDAAARRLMLSFHEQLLAGLAPAAALARAQARARTAGFVCLGTG
jgi:CHAT domain